MIVKKIFMGALRVGRAAALALGIGVMLAVVFGVASAALAHSGVDAKLFHLGHSNSATTPTSLVSTLADAAKSALIVTNKSGGPALDLRVTDPDTTNPALKDVAPMKVDSQAKVTNLNSDELDGKDSASFYATGSKVEDSNQLDGVDSTRFIQGKGNIYHGRRSVSRVNAFDEIEVPGFGVVRGRCLTDTGGQLVWVNGSGQTQEASWFNKDGVGYRSLASGNLVELTPATTQDYVVVLQVGSQGRTATITATQHVTSTDCNFSAQAVAQID